VFVLKTTYNKKKMFLFFLTIITVLKICLMFPVDAAVQTEKYNWGVKYHTDYENFMQGKNNKVFDYFVDNFEFFWQGTLIARNKNELKVRFDDFKNRLENFHVSWDEVIETEHTSLVKFHNFFFTFVGCPHEEGKYHGYTVCILNDNHQATHCQAALDVSEEAVAQIFAKSDKCLKKKSDL